MASLLPKIFDTGHGSTPQIEAAYSAIVRSLENFPELAIFNMILRASRLDRHTDQQAAMIALIVPPLPAASRPSKTMMTRSPL